MDPLSIMANTIALTKLASAAIKDSHHLNDALRDGPIEILATKNEVADVKLSSKSHENLLKQVLASVMETLTQ